jgi:hypothetical protein
MTLLADMYIKIVGQISYKLQGLPDDLINELSAHYYCFISARPLYHKFPLEHMQLAFYDLYKKYYYKPADISEFDIFFRPDSVSRGSHGILHMLQEMYIPNIQCANNNLTEAMSELCL